jgi:hypothetical protein
MQFGLRLVLLIPAALPDPPLGFFTNSVAVAGVLSCGLVF